MRHYFGSADVSDNTFAETNLCLAITNKAPVIRGHSLVLPKRAVVSLLGMSGHEKSELFAFAEDVTRFLLHTFGCTAFDWTLQDGEAAGQTVPHVHIHIIPRTTGDLDKPEDWYPALQRAQRLQIEGGQELSRQDLIAITTGLRTRWTNWASRG